MTVLIVGGGIGGLTVALSLHQIGVGCRVFESVSVPRPLGVGINLLPHAVRELTELGLESALAETGIPTAELAYYNKRGQRIWSEARGREAGYNWPQFSIHRGLLQLVLLEAARERLGAHNILTGCHLDGWEETSTKVIARFIDKRSGERLPDQEGDLLLGVDGIHSAVRQILYPNEGPPLWNGAILWRGTSRAKPFLTGRSMIMAGHEFQKFVCLSYRQSGIDAGRGGDQLDRRAQIPAGSRLAARGLEPHRKSGGLSFLVRRLAVRLAGRAWFDPGR
jgi:2-polyprenyl-6-methoxyphenol hydroxylase-like FAD-dependent oxidoreductase